MRSIIGNYRGAPNERCVEGRMNNEEAALSAGRQEARI
jgi:hypothetical protein